MPYRSGNTPNIATLLPSFRNSEANQISSAKVNYRNRLAARYLQLEKEEEELSNITPSLLVQTQKQ